MKKVKISTVILLIGIITLMFGCNNSESEKNVSEPTISQETSESVTEQISDDQNDEMDEQPQKPKKKIKVQVPEEEVEVINLQINDIKNHPAEQEIIKLVETGVVEIGTDGLFRPNEVITRGEFINWIYQFDNKGIKPHHPDTPSFSDLDKNSPYYDLIEGLKAGGLLVGYSDGTIKTEKVLERQELALLWGWYVQNRSIVDPLFDPSGTLKSVIPDYEQIGKMFMNALFSYKNTLWRDVFGDTAKLRPQQGVTRAEAAQWIILGSESK